MSLRSLGVGWFVGVLALVLTLGTAGVGARTRHPSAPHSQPPVPRHRGGHIYRDPTYTPAERAADLVARMTVAEKAAQMTAGYSPPIKRLHVQPWAWWNEAAHGVEAQQILPGSTPRPGGPSVLDNTTSYPDDLALGSTWDPSLSYQQASAISDEARELAPDQSRDLDFFAPTINLSRDPRWGRNDETFSEDPLLTADMASGFVDGFEGKDPQGRLLRQGGGYLKAIATLKHYAANNDELQREIGSSNLGEATLREYYTAQFARTIEQSQPGAIMSAFNAVNGTPSAANVHLMQTLARQTYGFDGYFVSDCDGIDGIVDKHHWQPHGYPRPLNATEARAFADAAGEDLNCNLGYLPFDYRNLLPAASAEGIRTQTDTYNANDMDASLVRLFTARMQTGEFDRVNSEPWVRRARAELHGFQWTNDDSNGAFTETPQRLALAQRVADGAVVLLKNQPVRRSDGSVGPLLPLRVPTSGPFKVAVIGHLGARLRLWLGDYPSNQGAPGVANEVSPYQGIKAAIQAINPSAQVDFYDGFTSGDTAASLTNVDQNAVAAAANYNLVIVDAATDWTTSGEGFDRTTLNLPGAQAQLIQEVAAKNPDTIVAMQTAGDVNVQSFQGSVPAIVWSAFDGQREGAALADVLTGKHDPSGHLPFTWYQGDAELPPLTDYRIRPGAGVPGRTYMYFGGPVSYPFGYGLSYTTFKDSDLRVSHVHLSADDTERVTVNVTNTGPYPGEDLVQLYVTTPGAKAAPRKRLEGFRQVYLTPGQTGSAKFDVKIGDLAFWTGKRFAVHDGNYGLQIASSAAAQGVQLSRSVHVHGALTPRPTVVTASPQMPGDGARGIQERVMFPERTAIKPNLTVSMNDATLYGYIRRGASRPLPSGLRVRFSSDNPAVVAVSGQTLRTVANGAATVTATVTYHGTTASGQFVVRVLSELSGIALKPPQRKVTHRGKKHKPAPATPLRGFEPDTYTYDVVVPLGQRAPRIVASTPDRLARVQTRQAAAVPGAGQVTITGPDDITHTYTVYFARPATSFTGAVGQQWRWINEDPAAARIAGNSVSLNAQPGELGNGSARNVLVQPALGNWTIDTRLTFSTPPSAAGQAAGIIAYQDDSNYLNLDWEFDPGGPRLVETTTDSLSGTPVSQVLASVPTAGKLGSTVWLRMVKHGPRYATYYSADGVHFSPVYGVGAALSDVKVGLFAVGSGQTASFGYFHVKSSSPVSLH